jgi:hypothetical protein
MEHTELHGRGIVTDKRGITRTQSRVSKAPEESKYIPIVYSISARRGLTRDDGVTDEAHGITRTEIVTDTHTE